MTKWKSFTYGGIVYDLSHLDPSTEYYIQPSFGGKPEQKYKVHVGYSHHCFTNGDNLQKQCDPSLLIRDSKQSGTCNGDPRPFDVDRYKLSFYLPSIVKNIHIKKTFHTGKGNFFLVELVDSNGVGVEYEVYFKVYKASSRGWLDMIVQSAYTRTKNPSGRTKKGKPINIFALFNNVLKGKVPREPI